MTWATEVKEDSGKTWVIVRRPSPYCSEHGEGLRMELNKLFSRETHEFVLKQDIIYYSAGIGACMRCHPDAEFDREAGIAALDEWRKDIELPKELVK